MMMGNAEIVVIVKHGPQPVQKLYTIGDPKPLFIPGRAETSRAEYIEWPEIKMLVMASSESDGAKWFGMYVKTI